MRKIPVIITAILLTGVIYASEVNCENENGTCVFYEDGSYECQCGENSPWEGSGVAGSPVNGEVTMPTEEECLEFIDEKCELPEGAVTCENPAGECIVYEDGSYYCDCLDGSSGGGTNSEPGNSGDSETGSDDSSEPTVTCSSDVDCPEGYACVNGVCGSADDIDTGTDSETCSQDSDCSENYVCINGYCEYSDETEVPVCGDVLVEVCGSEAPDLKTICSDESLPYCVQAISAYSEKCGSSAIPQDKVDELLAGTWNEYAADTADCCRGYEAEKTFYDDLIECLDSKTCEECLGEFEEASGNDQTDTDGETSDAGNTGDTGSVVDAGDTEAASEDSASDKSTDSSSSSGCSIVNI